jgi:drug/metabolite transporter (DMT)-like permease
VANTWIKRRFNETPPLVLLMCTMGIAAMVLVPASLVVPPGAAPDGDVTPLPVAVGAMLALGVVCTAIAPFMFYKLVQSHGPLFAGMVTYVIPCVAMLLGWAQGETISPMQLAALGGILAMVALVQTAHPKPADAAAEGGACMALPEDGESGDTAYSLPDRPASSAESP